MNINLVTLGESQWQVTSVLPALAPWKQQCTSIFDKRKRGKAVNFSILINNLMKIYNRLITQILLYLKSKPQCRRNRDLVRFLFWVRRCYFLRSWDFASDITLKHGYALIFVKTAQIYLSLECSLLFFVTRKQQDGLSITFSSCMFCKYCMYSSHKLWLLGHGSQKNPACFVLIRNYI